MTIEELKQENIRHYQDGYISLSFSDAVGKLIDAEIERQREPEQTFSQCVECGQFYHDGHGYDYCPHCGLAIE